MTILIAQAGLSLVLLFLIGFFNTAQSSVFGLKGNDIAELKDARDPASKQLVKMLGQPRILLMSVITGNLLSTIALGVLGAIIAMELARVNQWNAPIAVLIGLVILSLIVILVGEITPRFLARGNTRRVSRAIIFPLSVFHRILYPVAFLVFRVTHFLSQLLGVTKENLFMSDEEIRTLVEVSEIQGALQEEEKAMIYSIFEFGETAVREIMIPRIDMVAVPITMRITEVLELIKKHRFSRMPLYDKRVDNITGIIFAKDLLPYLDNQSVNLEVGALGRPAYFVPERMKIDKLLREFQQRKTNIAIVVDEYGGTAGLVTLEDILEEIVGEIRDEYDFEAPLYRWIDENTLLVNGRMNLDDLEEIVVLGIEEDRDYDTLGGFLYSRMGDIPEPQTEIVYNDVMYTIDRVQGNRITRVKIELPTELLDEQPETDD